jgi:transcriptional regulator with XRE-family HTH domain
MPRTVSPLIPSTEELLKGLGDRLRLARLRRGLSAKQVAARAGMAPMTLRSLERGGSGVTMGAYLAVMQVLGLEKDLNLVAQADHLGRALQDARLTHTARAAEGTSSSIASTKHKGAAGEVAANTPLGKTQDSHQPRMTSLLNSLSLDQARKALDNLPDAQIRRALDALPSDQLREIAEASAKAIEGLNLENLRKTLDSLPTQQLHETLKLLSSAQVQAALATVSSEQLRNVIDSQSQAVAQLRKPLEDAKAWLDSSFASSKELANLIDTPDQQSRVKRR